MRRTILLLLLLLSINAFGNTISEHTARAVAEKFFSNEVQTKASTVSLTLVWDGEPALTKALTESEPAFYIYNNDNGGYVIVSGDDIVSPILAYSFDNSFTRDGMPENVENWFLSLREYINKARKEGYQPLDKTVKEWEKLKSGKSITTGTPVTYYRTANWDQEAPYFNLCPKDGGRNSLTGCAATAQAIVLRHHKYPEKGSGVIPGYTTDTRKIPVPDNDISSHTYDWENMPLEYDATWTSEQKTQVAQLMYDCGTALQMDYTANSSGAIGIYYRPELINHFGYSADCHYMAAKAYSTENWIEVLKAELDSNGPILYSGYASDGGHAFVIDGYDSENYFHINFGWSGSGNAYCQFPNFKGSSYNFCEDHAAVLNLKPSQGDEKGDIVVWLEPIKSTNVLSASISEFYKGAVFTVKTGSIVWSLVNSGYFEIAMLHTDYFGNFKDTVSGVFGVEANNGEYFSTLTFNCKISKDIEDLDKLILGYRTKGGDWKQVICPHGEEGTADAIYLGKQSLDALSNFSYDKETGIITINSISGVTVSVTDTHGYTTRQGVSCKLGVITIDTNVLPKGEYNVSIKKDEDVKNIHIKTGE